MNVTYSLKESCGWIYSGKNSKILACWDGCIEGTAGASSCNKNISIPTDFDYCMLKGRVNQESSV